MAGVSRTASARKRTRAQNEQQGEPSSAAKKRRLKPTPSSSPAAESPVPNGVSRRGRHGTSAQTDSWAVPSSEDERTTSANRSKPGPKGEGKPQANHAQPPASVRRQRSSVYDVPDSGEDELSTTAVTPRARRRTAGGAAAADSDAVESKAANGDESLKKRRGRPNKHDREAESEVQNSAISPDVPTRRGGRSRARQRPPRESPEFEKQQANGERAQKTRQPGKATNGNGGLGEDAPMLKGILTPRKRKSGGGDLRKSVAFDKETDEEVLDELAAGTPSKSARKRAQELRTLTKDTATDAEAGNDEEEDDEVCAICSKPDSAPPNEIVFCDNCDMAVHQECYGLAEIPEGDWICRNCSQDDATSASRRGLGRTAESVAVRETAQAPDIPNFDQHLRSAQRVLLDRCAGRRRIKLRGQDEAYEKAYQLVEQTVVAGEGNSMMVIGARGCGKTTLVESVISELVRRHVSQFHVVRLSGFIHTDDKLALREIWRQLGKEMEVEDELVNKTTNHADTMASLLALLSHPSEIAETHDGVTSRSIVFVIDEFDLFATHARQTLLYNLFDIAQARKAPIAVLGLTTRIDVVESLEKRVKSRFSHRYVYLSLPKSLPAYRDVCKQGLTVDDEDMALEGIDRALEGHSAFWGWWNERIEALFKTQGFADHLESHFYSTKSVSAFLTTCIMPLAALSATAPSLQIPPTSGLAVSLEPPDSKLHLLGSLSDLDLAMLIAAARLDIVAHTDTVNFAMAYDEYTSLMGKQRVQSATSGMLALGGGARVWGRGTAGTAWERLVALGLLVPAAPGGRGTAGLGGLDAKMWKVDVALEEIPAAVKLNAVLARWCREI